MSTQLNIEATVTLGEARQAIETLASRQSILLLSQPGLGKSDIVSQAAKAHGYPLRSLLGTQIAPEDVSGIPKVVGERSVFCPPRILLPEDGEPFCLFLDELPATSPEVQKAFYSLLLERRVGEFPLPEGTWVVAAGNRVEDQSLVRVMSAALMNRVTILHVRADRKEWFQWAQNNDIRGDVLSFLSLRPAALIRPVPQVAQPFSSPRAWARLSESLDMVEKAGIKTPALTRALAFGTVSPKDASIFSEISNHNLVLRPINDYLFAGEPVPDDEVAAWFVTHMIREVITGGNEMMHEEFQAALALEGSKEKMNDFLLSVTPELRCALMVNLVDRWLELGAEDALIATLREMIGLEK